MKNEENTFDFENYQPHESIPIPVPRRGLLSALATELGAYNKKVDGVPTLKTSDLGLLPQETFEQLKPLVVKGCQIRLQKGMVWATPPAAMEALVLFPVDAPALAAFNLFNGKTPIKTICAALAEKTGWPPEKARAYTRGLFLKLVSLRVCEPG